MDETPETHPDPTLTARLTRRAAERATQRPGFMAWILARYRDAEGVDDEQLARFLGISREALDHLALCGRPRPDLFKEDVEAIADHVGTDPPRLANLIRQVEALTAFARAPAAGGIGLLAAARSFAAEEAADYDAETAEAEPEATGGEDEAKEPGGERR